MLILNKVNLSLLLLPTCPRDLKRTQGTSLLLVQVEGRITEEPSYPGPSSFRLFRRGRFKVGRFTKKKKQKWWDLRHRKEKRCQR